MRVLIQGLVLSCFSVVAIAVGAAPFPLPHVDLGYQIHQASYYNDTGHFYNFTNIRYGAPPTGQLRFQKPQAPAENRSSVQTGAQGRVCPRADASWFAYQKRVLPGYILTRKLNETEQDLRRYNESVTLDHLPSRDPRTTEDCLFLDVLVPKKVLKRAGKGPGAPVLVWIYGGGYTGGDKTDAAGAGLIRRGEAFADGGIIYVAINYRLGAFGWLSGPTFAASGGTPNAGLHDQLLALNWVQEHISKFGGDPEKVTVMGASAGAGSIMHLITSFGGTRPVPFQQAVLISPGFTPTPNNLVQEETYRRFLELTNATSLEDLKRLPSKTLLAANEYQIARSRYGSLTYGPTVQGDLAPALPGTLLAQGRFNHNVKIMVSHNSQEGLLFSNLLIDSEARFQEYLDTIVPAATTATKRYISSVLYPPPPQSQGGLLYSGQTDRATQMVGEVAFDCNTHYLNRAFNNQTYAWYLNVPPGLHGQDAAWVFYNDGGPNESSQLHNTNTALGLQQYITSFVATGTPRAHAALGNWPPFVQYGSNNTLQSLEPSGFVHRKDPAANERCDWWQKVLYD